MAMTDVPMPDRPARVIGRRAVLGGVVLASLIAGLPALAAAPSARVFLAGIYAAYLGPSSASRGVAIDTRARIGRYFAPDLAALIADDADAAARNGDEGELDGDPFIDGQDWTITDLAIAVRPAGPRRAVGVVTFRNFGKPTSVTLDLVLLPPGWRITDIHWAEGTLRGLYATKGQ
jgi:hypothetical protein